MKTAEFKDHTLGNYEYTTFKNLVAELAAMWEATALQHGTNAVCVRDSRLSYLPSMVIMTREQRATQDPEAEWQRILEICKQFGFQTK